MEEKETGERFRAELEFIQSLSNPLYLRHLALEQYHKQESFMNYMKYLQYFRSPPYRKYLTYPNSLHILPLVIHEEFWEYILHHAEFITVMDFQFYGHWLYYDLLQQ